MAAASGRCRSSAEAHPVANQAWAGSAPGAAASQFIWSGSSSPQDQVFSNSLNACGSFETRPMSRRSSERWSRFFNSRAGHPVPSPFTWSETLDPSVRWDDEPRGGARRRSMANRGGPLRGRVLSASLACSLSRFATPPTTRHSSERWSPVPSRCNASQTRDFSFRRDDEPRVWGRRRSIADTAGPLRDWLPSASLARSLSRFEKLPGTRHSSERWSPAPTRCNGSQARGASFRGYEEPGTRLGRAAVLFRSPNRGGRRHRDGASSPTGNLSC